MSSNQLLSIALMYPKMHGVDGVSATNRRAFTINQIMHEELETPWDIFPIWIFIFIRETL